MIEESVDKNVQAAAVGAVVVVKSQPSKEEESEGSFFFVFCVTRPWCICCVAAVVRCQFPAHLRIGFFFLSSHLCWLCPPPLQQLSSYSHLTSLSRLLFLILVSSFPVTILRRHPSELYAYLLWALTALCFGLFQSLCSVSNPTVLEEPLSSSSSPLRRVLGR